MNLKKVLRENYLLIIILFAGFLVRLFYFLKAMHQPLWWDEAEYLSKGLELAGKTSFKVFWAPHRQIGAPLLWALFFKLGLGEIAIRVFELFMSVLGIWLTYLVGKEIFNKRVGLIACSMMAFSYLYLFFTIRTLNGLPTSVLWLATIYFFWKGYFSKGSPFYIYAAALTAVISFVIYYSIGFLFVSLFLFLLITDRFRFLKNKHVIFAFIGAIVALTPMFVWYYHNTGHILPMLSNALSVKSSSAGQLYWFTYIKFFPMYLHSWGSLYLFIFIVAVAYMLFMIVLGYDLLIKPEMNEPKKYLFLFLWVLPILLAFMWVYRTNPNGEPRFMLPIFAALFISISILFDKLYIKLSKTNKLFAAGVIIALLVVFAVPQLVLANNLIMTKLNSYAQIRDAGLWIRAHSSPDDIIVSASRPQLTYYARRKTISTKLSLTDPTPDKAGAIALYKKIRPRYFVVSVFERPPDWFNKLPQDNPDQLVPVQAYYINYKGRQMPAVVIYEFKGYNLS